MHAWSDDNLDRLRTQGDPSADALVAAETEAGRLGALYAWLGDAGAPSPELGTWLAERGRLPEGADAARMARGQHVYGRHAVQAMLALLCKGLPEAYAAPKGAQLLLLAGRFAREPKARLMETARFFAAVMEPGGFDGPAPKAVQEILKVRLVHAVARRHVRRHPDYRPELGEPVNQEDLLGTLMSFSTLVLDALPQLGVWLSAEEERDYLHVWQGVGHLLGIDPDWIPDDPHDGRALFARIRERHHAPSPAGRVLAHALLDTLRELLPGDALDDLPVALVWQLCNPSVPRFLDLPEPGASSLALRGLRGLGRLVEVGDESPLLAAGFERLGRGVFDLVVAYGTGGERPRYTPPGAGG